MGDSGERLDRLRGRVAPRRHNARTIAALTGNPGCARRAVLDAAGVDKQRLGEATGFPARFGQSRFAITRGNAFEAYVKSDGAAQLRRLLGELLGADVGGVGYLDLGADRPADDADRAENATRQHRSAQLLAAAVADRDGMLFDHPLLGLDVAGQRVHLEPDLVAFQLGGRYHVIEIKSFPVIDGQGDPGKVSAAATQAAVYVLALRELLADAGHDPAIVSADVVLVCPRDFSFEPVAALIDVRRQLLVLRRQLARLARIDAVLARLPEGLSVDLALDDAGRPIRSPAELTAALSAIEARYAPDCLSTCELAAFCREEATGGTAALGRPVREELGGIDEVATALALARDELIPDAEQAEAAALLRRAAQLRAEALG